MYILYILVPALNFHKEMSLVKISLVPRLHAERVYVSLHFCLGKGSLGSRLSKYVNTNKVHEIYCMSGCSREHGSEDCVCVGVCAHACARVCVCVCVCV